MSTRTGFLPSLSRLPPPARDHLGLAATAGEANHEAVKAGPSLLERLAARRRADDTSLARLNRPL